jgi:hypothetical protein
VRKLQRHLTIQTSLENKPLKPFKRNC